MNNHGYIICKTTDKKIHILHLSSHQAFPGQQFGRRFSPHVLDGFDCWISLNFSSWLQVCTWNNLSLPPTVFCIQVCDFFVALLPMRKRKKTWFQIVDVQKAHPQFVTMPVLNGCIWRFPSRINQQPSALRVAHHDVLLLDKSAEMDAWMMDDFMADFFWRSSVDWSLASLRRSLWQLLGLI